MPATATTRSRTVRDEHPVPVARPKNDAYTILLLISLLATIAGCIMLYLDFSKYPEGKPPQPTQPNPIRQQIVSDAGKAR